MIIESIIDNFFNAILMVVTALFSNLSLSVPEGFATGLDMIMSSVGFFLPIQALLPLFSLVFLYYGARISMHFIRFLVNLCHLGID